MVMVILFSIIIYSLVIIVTTSDEFTLQYIWPYYRNYSYIDSTV